MALQWADEKCRLQIKEADIKWERDFFIGKLLENETRNEVATERLQDQMLLVCIMCRDLGLSSIYISSMMNEYLLIHVILK